MDNKSLLTTGLIGTALTSICCVTPAIVVLSTGVGLSAALGYVDLIALPAVAGFSLLTLYAVWRLQKRTEPLSK